MKAVYKLNNWMHTALTKCCQTSTDLYYYLLGLAAWYFCANMCTCDFFHRYQDSNTQPQPRACPSLPLGYTITCDQQWDIFLLSSFSNILYNIFHIYNDLINYKAVDLIATNNFHIYFFPIWVIWKFWKFKVQILNYVFGCQNNLNWKNFQLQSCRSDWDLQLLYRQFFNLR